MEQPKKVVRNIPIFIESRNEILINNDETDHNFSQSFKKEASPANDLDRNQAQSSSRDDIPQKVEPFESIKQQQSNQAHSSSKEEENPSLQQEKHLESSIEKIQTIQVFGCSLLMRDIINKRNFKN